MTDTAIIEMTNSSLDDRDHVFMEQAFALAARADVHLTHPNPLVGAVITDGKEIIATGYHSKVGEGHAEAIALEHAGARAAGATLYTTLEPCSYNGSNKRTAPCVEKIIAAGISRVVIGAIDPNERESGRGVEILRQHNVHTAFAETQEHFIRQTKGIWCVCATEGHC